MTIVIEKKPMVKTHDWLEVGERVAREIEQDAARHDQDSSFVAGSYEKLKESGLLKALVPEEFGGGSAGYGQICRVIQRLGASCGSTALAFSMHCHLVAAAAWRWRHQNAPTEGLLKRVANEDLVLVSSGGSDWLDSGGTATKTDGGYLVNGRKIFSSGCPAGNLLVTSAVHDEEVLHFAVPMNAKGVAILDTWHVMGMRGTGSHDIQLTDVFVPDAAISGRRPRGKWHPLFHIISMIAFPLIYSAYAGIAGGARDVAVGIAKMKPACTQRLHLVGEMENTLATATMALDAMIEIAETEMPSARTTNCIMIRRTLAGQAAIKTVERAMEVAGGASFYQHVGLERAFRDVQGARFHPLQEQAQLDFSGRVALGIDIDA